MNGKGNLFGKKTKRIDKRRQKPIGPLHTRWLERMTLAPFLMRYLMVGTAARMRVSSVMTSLSSNGTLRSARTNTRLPLSSASPRSPTLFFLAIQTKARSPPPLLPPCSPIHVATRANKSRCCCKPQHLPFCNLTTSFLPANSPV